MKILFASSQAYPPQFIGGSQRSVLTLAQKLQERGHSVSILCGLWGGRIYGMARADFDETDGAEGHI